MNETKKTYHHGDLGLSLQQAASQMIAQGGVEALSMRKLADKVGVSRTAPYHHFKDKNALLCAIAEQGFLQHQKQLEEITVSDQQLSGVELFRHYVHCYIRFASSEPQTYDLMFGRYIWKQGQPTQSLRQVSKRSFHCWLEWIEQLQKQQVLSAEEETQPLAQACWAMMHGLCRLLNDGIYVDADELDAMTDCAVRMMLR